MTRTTWWSAFAISAACLFAHPSWACKEDKDADCPCKHQAKESKTQSKAAPVKGKASTDPKGTTTSAIRLFEPLSGHTDELKVPQDARRDASAGVFI